MSKHTKVEALSALKRQSRVIAGLLALGRFLPFGYLFGTRFERDFSTVGTVEETGEFVRFQEFEDPDEQEIFSELSALFSGDVLKHPKGRGKKNRHHQDDHWGYSTGLLAGQLKIDNLDHLPAGFRKGLFEQAGEYNVIGRPNFLYERPTVAVTRLSLKLEQPLDVPNVYSSSGVAKELDLLMSEGVIQQETGDQDGQGFFFRDARQLLLTNLLKSSKLRAVWLLLNSANGAVYRVWNHVFQNSTDTLYAPAQRKKGWSGKYYFSAGPYALGEGAMKFALKPLQSEPIDDVDHRVENPASKLRRAFDKWASKGVAAEFEFQIQLARWDSISTPDDEQTHPPKAVMAAEYTDLVWDEAVSPFVTVGRLTLRPAVWDPHAQWYGKVDDRWCSDRGFAPHALRFNAWNTFADMRPLGQLFRARKFVHARHRDARLAHSFQEVPQTKSKCPMGAGRWTD